MELSVTVWISQIENFNFELATFCEQCSVCLYLNLGTYLEKSRLVKNLKDSNLTCPLLRYTNHILTKHISLILFTND